MNILNWLSQDPLADRMYHVNKKMLLSLHDPLREIPPPERIPRSLARTDDYRRWLNISERVFDLSELFDDVELLMKAPEAVLDPEVDYATTQEEYWRMRPHPLAVSATAARQRMKAKY